MGQLFHPPPPKAQGSFQKEQKSYRARVVYDTGKLFPGTAGHLAYELTAGVRAFIRPEQAQTRQKSQYGEDR